MVFIIHYKPHSACQYPLPHLLIQCFHKDQPLDLYSVLYTASLSTVIKKHSVLHHLCANDSQLKKSAAPHQISDLLLSMQKCTDDIKTWITVNKLQLNRNKTKAMIVSSGRKSVNLFLLPRFYDYRYCICSHI